MPGAPLVINTFVDGEHTLLLPAIRKGWSQEWAKKYGEALTLTFSTPVNLKTAGGNAALPPHYRPVAEVRNPDLFFFESTRAVDLGGIEVTVHSPDGSNADKRYPYLWASRRAGLSAFIACPYQKGRATGQTNRLPYRHSVRNIDLLNEWMPGKAGQLCQIVPTRDLQLPAAKMPPAIKVEMYPAEEFGRFFAHLLASKVFSGSQKSLAIGELEQVKARLLRLATACRENSSLVEASSLLKNDRVWIQVYNTRPDSGHWERGEGQFDSIDGRVMFTLDTISLLPSDDRPSLELWLPQVTRSHPWVVEQRTRGYNSKRFRNLMVVLSDLCTVKFADQLTASDWKLLQEHQELTLERLDWDPGIYRFADLVTNAAAPIVARQGLKNPPAIVVREIAAFFRDPSLYFSSHRGYLPGWMESLRDALKKVPDGMTVLLPRIPSKLIPDDFRKLRLTIVPAEMVTKAHLLALRQLHRQG